MFGAELVIVLLAIYLGARLGGIGIGFAAWPWRPCPDAYFSN
ncbi:anaerobic C4-dicarboxylate transporter family protein [Klebsiella pneumoniae]|nr:anaerobic C4-dicarboxylate transporter family protein [Klebsiella pneumoniae]VCV26753.1 hypothetical protein BANRA_00025 [Klebsiella pneumoniae]